MAFRKCAGGGSVDLGIRWIAAAWCAAVVCCSGPRPAAGEPAAAPAPAAKRFSLEFRDAELKDVLRLIGQESGLNVVVGKGVEGKITLSLQNTTLQEALDAILESFNYSYRQNGTVITVTPAPSPVAAPKLQTQLVTLNNVRDVAGMSALVGQIKPLLSKNDGVAIFPDPNTNTIVISDVAENVTRLAALARSLDTASPLTSREVPIPYLWGDADIQKLVVSLKPMLSGLPGADIAAFPSTNSLIISDVPERVERIAALVQNLGSNTPQVKIEARILEVKDIYQKELGIQWGGQYRADAGHGNALPVAFPNAVSIGGTEGAGSYLVNLPATSPVAGVGLSMGHIANTLSLDLKLSAMEKTNKIKILSTPSLLTMQGKEAVIKVGEQIPYRTSTTSNSVTSTTVSFKDVFLQLRVVPSVLPQGRIVMDLAVTKDTRGQAVVFQDQQDFAIDSKSLTTRIVLRDGETAVIGGLYTQQDTGDEAQVPALGRLPLIGWLFRSRRQDKQRNELLIFLTPRIQPL